MLQGLNNLQMLPGCHKTWIEGQHSLHVLHEPLDEAGQPAVARGPGYPLVEVQVWTIRSLIERSLVKAACSGLLCQRRFIIDDL